jgi:hypothetical protein
LDFVVNGQLLQAQTPDGRILMTPEQAEAAWRQAETGTQRAESERAREAEARREAEEVGRREADARREAEAEVERLRREIERLRRRGE